MLDPTVDDNLTLLMYRSDMNVVSVKTVVETFPAGVFHYRLAYNAVGQVVYRSPWAPGTSGSVNGY